MAENVRSQSVRFAAIFFAGWSVFIELSAAETSVGHRSQTTKHFLIRSHGTAAEVQRLGERCEKLLAELNAKWFDEAASAEGWTPRCELIVHGNIASYLREVPGGERTVGSSWIETQQGRVVARRIDVRGDQIDWFEGAMPHELMHVLLADRFVERPMPRWAEEGLALLADTRHKQELHDLDFRRAAAAQKHFRLVELLTAAEYPASARRPTFYGQSASLVRYLASRGRPAAFVTFIERAGSEGYDAALRATYDIHGTAALEAEWLRSVRNDELATRRRQGESSKGDLRPTTGL